MASTALRIVHTVLHTLHTVWKRVEKSPSRSRDRIAIE